MASEQAGNDPQMDFAAQQNRSSSSISASPGDGNCSPRVGLCAVFGVCRFLASTRPILTSKWAKCRICHGIDDGNRIGEGMWGEVC